MDIYNNVIDCSGVYIKVIATKLAAQSIEFEVGGGKMPRILNTRISASSTSRHQLDSVEHGRGLAIAATTACIPSFWTGAWLRLLRAWLGSEPTAVP
jgi:hypothetical protein